MMNSDPGKANGTPFKGQLKEKWGALTDDDLETIAGRKDRLAGKLQERCGYGNEQAQREAEEFLHSHREANGGASAPASEPTPVPAPWAAPLGGPSPGAPTDSAQRAPWPPPQDGPSTNPPKTESPPAAGYAHSATVWISPLALRWVAPVTVGALFVLLFLPWLGVYPGGYGLCTQNAFQTIWGGVSVDPVVEKALGSETPYERGGGNRLMLFYTLFVVLALILVLAPLGLTAARIATFPFWVRSVWQRRRGLLGTLALGAFVLLLTQLWVGFRMEAAVAAPVNGKLTGERAAARTAEEKHIVDIHRGLLLGRFNVHRTFWLDLAVAGHVLLLAGLGLEFWLARRGTRPLPRIDFQA